MDTLLQNGDHALDGRGVPAAVEGVEETAQRALIRLCVRRGAFPRDPRLGSGLHRLRGAASVPLDRLALSYAQEALAPMAGVQVTGAACTPLEPEGLLVRITARWDGADHTLEVGL